jgi:TPR repeat protein
LTMQVLFRLFCIFFLFIDTSNAFADRLQALTAQSQGDYVTAARVWQEMANKGDPVAQYNLALLYQNGTGVNQDRNISRYWLAMAARNGVIGAYKQINADSVKPMSRRISVQQEMSPMDWIASQNPGHYTLQLASSTNEKLIKKYYIENALYGKAGYYRSLRGGEYWFALVYGVYPSVNDAKEAINNLPPDLKKWSPWVRNIRSIHNLMVR